MIKEAKEIQESITKKKKVPKKYLINDVLVKVNYSFQTKLMEISEEEAIKLLEEQVITGLEGFFCLKSSKNLTLVEALATYMKSGLKNFIYVNFDPMNTLILRRKQGIT